MRCAARPAVVACDVEAVVAEPRHHFHLVLCHAPEGIVAVIREAARLAAVAVAAQVRRDDRKVLREPRRDEVPVHVGERIAVHEQHRRSRPAVAQVDADARIAGLDPGLRESFVHCLRPFDGRPGP
jgi:hypothetical protein